MTSFCVICVSVFFRDVKPDNILLDEQGKDVFVLCISVCGCVCVLIRAGQ